MDHLRLSLDTDWCLVCGKQRQNDTEEEFSNIFKGFTDCSQRKYSDCLSSAVHNAIKENSTESELICRSCVSLLEKSEMLAIELHGSRQFIRHLYNSTLCLAQKCKTEDLPLEPLLNCANHADITMSPTLPFVKEEGSDTTTTPSAEPSTRATKRSRKTPLVPRKELTPEPPQPKKLKLSQDNLLDPLEEKPSSMSSPLKNGTYSKQQTKKKKKKKKMKKGLKIDVTSNINLSEDLAFRAAVAQERDERIAELAKERDRKRKQRIFEDSEFESQSDEDCPNRDPDFRLSRSRRSTKRLRSRRQTHCKTYAEDSDSDLNPYSTTADSSGHFASVDQVSRDSVSDSSDHPTPNNSDPLACWQDHGQDLIIKEEPLYPGFDSLETDFQEPSTSTGKIRVKLDLFEPSHSSTISQDDRGSFGNSDSASVDKMCVDLKRMLAPHSEQSGVHIKVERHSPSPQADPLDLGVPDCEVICDLCGEDFTSRQDLGHHYEVDHFAPNY